MVPDRVELHDGVLRSLSADFEERTIVLRIDAYLTPDESLRKAIAVTLIDVDDLACFAAFISMSTNKRAGNINYWSPGAGGTPTYIYLNDGCIAIRAKHVRVSVEDPPAV